VLQSKTPTGITMKATLNRFFKKEKSGPKEVVSAVVEPKYEWKEKNMEFSAKLSTANEFSGTLAYKDAFIRGSKLEFCGTQTERDGIGAQVTASHKTDVLASKVSVTYPVGQPNKKDKNPIKLVSEVVLQYPKNLLFGTLVSVGVDSENSTFKAEGLVSYTQGDVQVSARGSHDRKTGDNIFGTSFFHLYSPKLKYSMDFDIDQANVRGPIAAVAAEYKLDDSTSLKGKYAVKVNPQSKQSEMRIGLAARQKISPYFTTTFGADLNLSNLLGSSIGDAHTFGMELKLQD